MICTKCDPAGHIGGEEREFLKRIREARMQDLKNAATTLNQIVKGDRPPSRFTGEHIHEILRDLDAIRNLQVVVGLSL